MKFDIVKFIDDACQDYLQGWRAKKSVLNDIKSALEENSWPMLCDDKEMIDGTVEADGHTWTIHPNWCIEDKMEDEDE